MKKVYGFTEEFQSLIHQVSVSFKDGKMISLYCLYEFQSLIHQVSVSFSPGSKPIEIKRVSFNPLFIRSVFLL